MKLLKKTMLVVAISIFVLGISGCKEKGPAEKAGEKLDQTMEKATEKAGEKLDQTMEKAAEKADDSMDK